MKILQLIEDDRGFGDFDMDDDGGAEMNGGVQGVDRAPVGGGAPKNPNLRLRDLSTLQVAMLKKIASGMFDIENMRPNQQTILDELNDLGLVDDQYELTAGGQRAVELSGGDETPQREPMDAEQTKPTSFDPNSMDDEFADDSEFDEFADDDDDEFSFR